MKVIDGHLTQTEKKAILAILDNNLMCGKVGKKDYFISFYNGVYTVKIKVIDKGLIPCPGSKLRLNTYISTFIL